MQIGKTGSLFALWRFFGVLLGALEHPLQPRRKICCTGYFRGVTHGICRAFLSPQVKMGRVQNITGCFQPVSRRCGEDNAIAFSPDGGEIEIAVRSAGATQVVGVLSATPRNRGRARLSRAAADPRPRFPRARPDGQAQAAPGGNRGSPVCFRQSCVKSQRWPDTLVGP